MSGDLFGDAVNVAARLLDHAGDNETLATVSVLEGLDDWERSRFRSLDRIQLRGRAEPVHVHLRSPCDASATPRRPPTATCWRRPRTSPKASA